MMAILGFPISFRSYSIKIIFAFWAMLVLSSTLKAQIDTRDSLYSYLEGRWEAKKSCGGLRGGCFDITYKSVMFFEPVSTSSDSLFQHIFHEDTLFRSEKISFAYKAVSPSVVPEWYKQPEQLIRFYINPIHADSFWIVNTCIDCPQVLYARKQQPLGFKRKIEPSLANVYPNPFTDTFSIPALSEGTVIAIRNMEGQVVYGPSLNAPNDLSKIPSGLYMLELTSQTQTVQYKVMKK